MRFLRIFADKNSFSYLCSICVNPWLILLSLFPSVALAAPPIPPHPVITGAIAPAPLVTPHSAIPQEFLTQVTLSWNADPTNPGSFAILHAGNRTGVYPQSWQAIGVTNVTLSLDSRLPWFFSPCYALSNKLGEVWTNSFGTVTTNFLVTDNQCEEFMLVTSNCAPFVQVSNGMFQFIGWGKPFQLYRINEKVGSNWITREQFAGTGALWRYEEPVANGPVKYFQVLTNWSK